MRHILVIGAGRSASSLIKYLLDHSEKEQLHVTIGDSSEELAKQKTNNHKKGAIKFCSFFYFFLIISSKTALFW